MSNKTILSKRIRELRGKMTQEAFGEIIGVHRNSLGTYESGRSEPDAGVIRKLSKHFNVSADYILGLTNVKTKNPKTEELADIYAELEEVNDLIKLLFERNNKLHNRRADLMIRLSILEDRIKNERAD